MLNVGRKYSLNDIKEQVNIKLEELQKKGAEIVNVNGVSNTNGEVSCMIIQYKNPKCEMKKCEHCGKYFIPQNRSDEKYCNNLYKDTGKTCKEIGADRLYSERLKNRPVMQEYRKAYQKKFAEAKRNLDNKSLKQDFENWKTEAKGKVLAYKKGNLDEKEVIKWILETK